MRARFIKNGLVFMVYFLLSVCMTYPLAFSYHRYPLFDHLEITVTFYNLWWQYWALFHLKINPWFNPIINYPDGYSMVFFPLFMSYGVFSYPLQKIFSAPEVLIGFIHWAIIFSFAFTGFLGYLLFARLSGSKLAGFISGVAFSFIPYHYWHLPRMHLSCLEFILLAVLGYFYLIDKRSARAGIVFGLSLVPLFYQSPNYLFYLSLFFLFHIVYMAIFHRQIISRGWIKGIFIAGITAFLLSSPYLLQVAKDLAHHSTPVLSTLKEQSRFSANIMGFFLPGENQKIYSFFARRASAIIADKGIGGWEIFPGYVALISGILGMIFARRYIFQSGFWIFCFFAYLILSLGPFLNFGSRCFFHFHLPFYYLRKIIPALELERAPARWAIISFLSLSVFSAGFFRWLEERLKGRRRVVVFSLLFGLILLELNQAPLKTNRINLPKFYQELCKKEGDFSLLELPFLPDVYRYTGFYQIWHKKPLVIDLTARKVGAHFWQDHLLFYLDEPKRFFMLEPEKKKQAFEQMKAELLRRKVGYIVVFLRFVDEEKAKELDELIRLFNPQKVYQSQGILKIYKFWEEENGEGGG